VRIVIDAGGIPNPADDVQLIREDVGTDGKWRHYFLCLGCRELIEAEDGQSHIHECEGSQESEPDLES
jgi:hypothetical protein